VKSLNTAKFRATGWDGPFELLTNSETRLLSKYLQDNDRPAPADWHKGLAASDRVIFKIASDRRILTLLKPLLGEHIVIWGAVVIDRSPGESHPWHTDIETANSSGNAVTVWIALENGSVESSLNLISGSHLVGRSLQQVASEHGLIRELRTGGKGLQLASSLLSDAALIQPEIPDGQGIIFDGRVWHGSLNQRVSGVRRSLVLQYASPDLKLRMPNWTQLDWPFEYTESPKPPLVVVSGKNFGRLNRVVDPPPVRPIASRPLESLSVGIPQPLPRSQEKGWRPSPLYRGSTPVLPVLSCHASILEPGSMPHPPHSHFDEEILIILDGEAEIIIASSEDDPAPRLEKMRAGDLVYYPSYQFHTIRCSGNAPVSYFMYRWNATIRPNQTNMQVSVFKALRETPFDGRRPFETSTVFEGPTGLLDLLHVHLSCAQQSGGYAEHRDEHDVAILLLEGAVKTMGRVIHAPAVVLYPAKTLHGLRGASEQRALYLAVEFHGPHANPPTFLETVRRRIGLLKADLKLRVEWRLNAIRSKIRKSSS